jgi:hypothetical protein
MTLRSTNMIRMITEYMDKTCEVSPEKARTHTTDVEMVHVCYAGIHQPVSKDLFEEIGAIYSDIPPDEVSDVAASVDQELRDALHEAESGNALSDEAILDFTTNMIIRKVLQQRRVSHFACRPVLN